MTLPEMPTVPVLGMQVPAPLVPRIIAALRGTYPDLAEGLDDDAVVRAVVKYWVVSTWSNWEGSQAEAPLPDAIQETRNEFAAAAQAARMKVLADAAAIVEAPQEVTP